MNEYELLNILMVLFSALIANTYLGAFRNHKKTFCRIRHLSWIAYILFQYLVMLSNASYPLAVLIINILLIFVIYKCLYHVENKTALFRASILYVLWMLVEVGVSYVLGKAGTSAVPYGFILGNVVSKIIMYILMHTLNHCGRNNTIEDISFKYWARLFFIPVVTIYIIHNTFCLTSQNQRDIFFLLTTILMILVNYVTFDVYDKLGKQLETEKKNLVYEQQIMLCNRQSAEREAAYQNTRRVRHDLNEYLVDLKIAIQSGKLNEAEEKIDVMLDYNRIYRNEISHSGNLIIDSLINYKYSLALKEGIDMQCHIEIPDQLPFSGADLCIILGNLLDNAIEAVSNLPNGQRLVDVSVSQVKGSLSITVQNPYRGNPQRSRTGQILTIKKDHLNHGIGLSSVQYSVDKYSGELQTVYENELFKTTVLLYPPENLHNDS